MGWVFWWVVGEWRWKDMVHALKEFRIKCGDKSQQLNRVGWTERWRGGWDAEMQWDQDWRSLSGRWEKHLKESDGSVCGEWLGGAGTGEPGWTSGGSLSYPRERWERLGQWGCNAENRNEGNRAGRTHIAWGWMGHEGWEGRTLPPRFGFLPCLCVCLPLFWSQNPGVL